MSLITFKLIAASIILLVSLCAGFVSIRIAKRSKRLLQIADALANGVFIGAALFHLLPNAIDQFEALNIPHGIVLSLALLIVSYAALLFIEKISERFSPKKHLLVSAWLLILTLSIHAFITGIALGISETLAIVSVLFFAIIAHKGFEMFALVISLFQRLNKTIHVRFIFFVFSFVTPLGIWLGTISDQLFSVSTNSLLTAAFNAFAAGTFLYVGSSHNHGLMQRAGLDSYKRYALVLNMLLGIALMGILAIWI